MTKKKQTTSHKTVKHEKSHDNMHHLHVESADNREEYAKFFFVISFIFMASSLHSVWVGLDLMQFLESFMGVFFIVFAAFKLLKLKEFAYGFQSYDLIAKKSLAYSFAYPFIQLSFGLIYILGYSNIWVDLLVLLISLVSGAGVLRTLKKGTKVHCVCLGNVIKLPLSTISFVEDFGMAIMASAMILIR